MTVPCRRERLALGGDSEPAAANDNTHLVAGLDDRGRPQQVAAQRLASRDVAGRDPAVERRAIGECARRELGEFDSRVPNVVGAENLVPRYGPRGHRRGSKYLDLGRQEHGPGGALDAAHAQRCSSPQARTGRNKRFGALASGDSLTGPPTFPENPLANPGNPMSIYNGMIYPLAPYAIKGALWYQGESNGGESDEYYYKMRALIGGWRKIWNQGGFPFYFVQLANFQQPNDNPEGGDGWAKIRMAQVKALTIPHTGMATIIDIGDGPDIHPKNKFDVGERLALWALHNDYGKSSVVVSGPLYKSITVEGSKIRVAFDHVGHGLMAGKKTGLAPTQEEVGAKLKRFAVAGTDKKWFWADALIDGRTVVVSSPMVPAPLAVRYAFTMNPEGANLYNREGLPASPFRTDEW